jgi:phosphatidylglycerophosphatase A
MNRLAVVLATAGGAGYAPVAPGTAGAAVGIVCCLLTRHWAGAAQAAFLLLITIAGVWASQRAARHFGRHDPGPVVIDEVAGQLVTLFLVGGGIGALVLGFLVFRVLDIVKPWPANALEALPGGWGIMADDLMAGLYGWAIMVGVMTTFPGWL